MISGTNSFDCIILGAGGAGLMCAATASRRERRVLVIDHAEAVGKKILISGGGRCNFTNLHTAADRYISTNPHFAKSALSRFTPQDFLALVDAHGIAWHEKTLGQLFCDGSARQIVDMLLSQCGPSVEIRTNASIAAVSNHGGRFVVEAGGHVYTAPSLVIATGGPSIPKMGATGFAYDLARQFGLKVVEPRPALVPFTLGGDELLFRELSGVAAPVRARAGGASFAEAALFTHRGLSGPAILQVSSYWRHGEAVLIDFVPREEEGWLRTLKRNQPRHILRAALSARLPARLAEVLLSRATASDVDLGLRELVSLKDAELESIEDRFSEWAFHPNGTEGYAKAEVTVGGISTAELSSRTMEAKKLPGLYCIGEAVDVTGWLGGYNFQWAWASGVAAGEVI